MPYIIEIGQRL